MCTKGINQAYIAPLSKLWGLFKYYLAENDMKLAEHNALRSLWYVRLCLRGKTITGEYIDEELFVATIE